MGRAKIAMEFIVKEKTRNTTYVKRKKGLLKKAHELSILCNVPVCIIIYPYKQDNHEVYSFKGDSNNAMDLARATDPTIAREMIDRYLRTPNEEKYKRALNLYDMFDEWTKKADQELLKLRHKNALVKYPSWDSRFDGLTLEQLMELLTHLDNKIEFVKQRISLTKSNIHNNNNHSHNNHEEIASLVPYYEPTPITSHQLGFPYVEGYNNQVNSYDNYTNSYNPAQQFCLPFNYPNLDNQGGSSSSGYQIMGGTRMDDQGDSSVKGSNLMYNMNSMNGMMPLYYDQGRGYVDNIGIGPTSLYGAGLTMSMPLQPLPNASLQQRPRQYQMFYKQDGWMGDDQQALN